MRTPREVVTSRLSPTPARNTPMPARRRTSTTMTASISSVPSAISTHTFFLLMSALLIKRIQARGWALPYSSLSFSTLTWV